MKHCSVCGAELPMPARFCGKCGSAQTPITSLSKPLLSEKQFQPPQISESDTTLSGSAQLTLSVTTDSVAAIKAAITPAPLSKQSRENPSHINTTATSTIQPTLSKDEDPFQRVAIQNLKIDLSRSGTAHMAQLTLISILLGAILAALFVGLPSNFATNIFVNTDLALDIRVLVTFLAAADLWIKYAWGIIVVRWPFSLAHNCVYFLISGATMFLALSVSNFKAWLTWGAITCFAGVGAYILNWTIVAREEKLSKLYHATDAETVIAEDPPFTKEEIRELKQSSLMLASMIFGVGIILLYCSLSAYQVLPTFGWAKTNLVPILGEGIAVCFMFADLLVQELIVMKKQRFGRILTLSRFYRQRAVE